MNLEPCQSFVANYQSTPDSILKDRLCMIENSSYLIMHVTCNKLDNQGLQIIKYIHWVPITLDVWRRKPESNPKEKKKLWRSESSKETLDNQEMDTTFKQKGRIKFCK